MQGSSRVASSNISISSFSTARSRHSCLIFFSNSPVKVSVLTVNSTRKLAIKAYKERILGAAKLSSSESKLQFILTT
jgi:hypothetical protein